MKKNKSDYQILLEKYKRLRTLYLTLCVFVVKGMNIKINEVFKDV